MIKSANRRDSIIENSVKFRKKRKGLNEKLRLVRTRIKETSGNL